METQNMILYRLIQDWMGCLDSATRFNKTIKFLFDCFGFRMIKAIRK